MNSYLFYAQLRSDEIKYLSLISGGQFLIVFCNQNYSSFLKIQDTYQQISHSCSNLSVLFQAKDKGCPMGARPFDPSCLADPSLLDFFESQSHQRNKTDRQGPL